MSVTRNGVWLIVLTLVAGLAWPTLGSPAAAVFAVAGVVALAGAVAAHVLIGRAGWCDLLVSANPGTVSRGDEVTVRVGVRTARPRAVRLRARVTGLGVEQEIGVPLRGSGEVPPLRACAARRGRRTVRTGEPTWSDPLDLFRRRVGGSAATEVTVLPRFARFVFRESSQDAALGTTERSADLTGLFAGLRAYVPGDDIRLIQWAASARTADGSVLVRQDVQPQAPSLRVVLDTAGWRSNDPSFETAVDIAYSLLRSAAAAGYALSLSCAAHHRLAGAAGLPAAARILLDLAPQPSAGPVVGVPEVLTRADPGFTGLTVVVTYGSGNLNTALVRRLRPPATLIQIPGASESVPGAVRRGGVPVLTAPDLEAAVRLWSATIR